MKSMLIRRLLAWLAVLLWMGVIFTFSAIPGLHSTLEPRYDFILRKAAHAAEYAVLAWLVFRALSFHGLTKGRAVTAAVVWALLYAVSDEYHQTFVFGRHGAVRDVVIDAAGIVGSALWIIKRMPQTVKSK